MTIQIDYEAERKLDIDYEKLASEVAEHILETENCPYDVCVNLVITDNEEIKRVNTEFRSIGAPTDVLSFPMIPFKTPADYSVIEGDDSYFDLDTDELILGDVMISVDKVYAQAEEYGHSTEREFSFLFAHSMLHLLGYDHMEPDEAAVMEAKQAKAPSERRTSMKKKFLAAVMALVMIGTTPVGVFADTMVKSYLTGLDVPESEGRVRPVAVMLNNIKQGCPQSGIANAGVVYEAPVEGDITRLMGIFEDYKDLERIGSVRSCRDYYIFYANEFDAIYAHYGQSAFALPYFEQHLIDNLNGVKLGKICYFRSTDRKAPHNAYTTYDLLQQGIDKMGYRREYKEDYDGHYVFVPDGTENTLPQGTSAQEIHFDNFTVNHPWFVYDENTKKYSRFQYGAAQIDDLTGEQLTCDNILIQYSYVTTYEGTSYKDIETITDRDGNSGGRGKYITRGKAIDVTWQKDSPWGVTHYITDDNQEVQLNPGTTWVEIVQDDRVDDISYQ